MTYVVERTFHRTAPRLLEAWPEHLAHLQSLAERGLLLGGGPAETGNGEILLLAVSDEMSLNRVLRRDPLARQGLVARTRIRSWNVAYGHSALTGRQSGPPSTAPGDVLTPHESRIARMVLSGMTNQKIADRLNVSCRAVEQHLTRMYRKLSIHRRAQLAPALGATVPRYGLPQEERLTA